MAPPFLYYRGRVGLYDILRQLGVGPGDEVVLQAFTCVAVPEAIMAVGATPVWADIAPESVNVDPAALAARITPRTRAVIVQHTFGVPAELDAILPLVQRDDLPLVEDCCHALASTFRQRVLGTIGDASFWSYEWGKPIVAGVGGEASFNDPALRAKAETDYAKDFSPAPAMKSGVIAAQFLLHALLYSPRRFWWVRSAFHALGRAGVAQSNYNPVGPGVAMAPDFGWRMCGFSQSRLERARAKAHASLPQRIRQAERYASGLRPESAQRVHVPPGTEAVYSRFPIFVRRKQELLAAARASNLEIAEWYSTPVHPLSGDDLRQVHYSSGMCPRAEAAAASLVSLPLGSKVTPDFQDQLIDLINRHAAG